ncbi:hypothetical protein [Actinokineospora diospyrosa]|uniref:hypothetical protein n=1 Tax=Actinokineospora diospyrosa TaxID=103728 RepID=UPI0020A52610|nr:hypothetical protein [Actinokineospora diospyrosa]
MADLGELTPFEQAVVDAARSGAAVDSPPGELRAELIRQLLLGVHGELDPRGVRLELATVVGLVDLDDIRTLTRLVMRHCVIPEGVSCSNAHLGEVDFSHSHLKGP